MTPEFIADAVRDLCLLAVGSALTLFGVYLTNRAARDREDAARIDRRSSARIDRDRDFALDVSRKVTALYAVARTQNEQDITKRVEFNKDAFNEAEMASQLVADADLRRLLEHAFNIARGVGPAVEKGYVNGPAPLLQSQAFYAAQHLLAAYIREDDRPQHHARMLTEAGEATNRVWREMQRNGQARRA